MGEYAELQIEADIYRAQRDVLRHERELRRGRNREVINRSGLKHKVTNNGECFCFREKGKPRVDFYPSTGRWRVVGQSLTYKGGAERFLRWYTEQ